MNEKTYKEGKARAQEIIKELQEKEDKEAFLEGMFDELEKEFRDNNDTMDM